MSTTKNITIDELNNLPPLSNKEKKTIRGAQPTPDEDSPALSKEQLKEFKLLKEANPELYAKLHPEWYKVKKTDIHIKIDNDVLSWFKAQGKGYQTKMNAVLRKYAFG